MGEVVDHETGEILAAGERTDDEWESYIRDANLENTIIERGRRWAEFFDHCQDEHGKQGGSRFREFASRRFGFSAFTASMWVAIGKGSRELFDNIKKFSPDVRGMYDYLRLSDEQKAFLLSSPGLIDQKAIKALKGTRGDHSNSRAGVVNCDPDVRIGDFREVLADIEPGTVDLILTDPPYPMEYIGLWSDLGAFAAEKLSDNGILIAYSGKYAMPEVLNRLSEHLNYWWMSAIFLDGPGHSTPLGNPVRKVISQWRPLVMFVKKGFGKPFRDVVPAGGKDKDNHNWSQSIAESMWIVDAYTDPGALVVDPMAGSGTVAKACRQLGRRFIGAEINADA